MNIFKDALLSAAQRAPLKKRVANAWPRCRGKSDHGLLRLTAREAPQPIERALLGEDLDCFQLQIPGQSHA
jgi:hypothetical protein